MSALQKGGALAWIADKLKQVAKAENKSKFSDNDIAKKKCGIRLFGLAFIAVGVWAILSELPLGHSGSRVTALLLAFIVPENRAACLYYICIGMGLIFLVISFMKPYNQPNKRKY